VEFYPPSASTKTHFSGTPLYYYQVSNTGVKGFVYKSQEITSLYTIAFPQDEVLETYYHDMGGQVASLGRVVGRDVLYKYLNSNIAVFITLKEGKDRSTLFVYLIDVVSGTIHSKIAHYGAGNSIIGSKSAKQIHVVKSDNIVVYSFWNHGTNGVDHAFFPSLQSEPTEDAPKKKKRVGSPSKHQEVVVLELYESAVFNKRFESPFYNSFSSDRISTIGQSFMLQDRVTGLGITRTGNGITSKEFLIGYDMGIQGVSRRILDARRPTSAPTSTDKEDGLIPYHPAILKNPQEIMTYFQDIQVSKFKTIETNLESTSLVVAYGGDLFITKRTPSGGFDTLSDDFAYTQIIGGLIGLSIALVVVRRTVCFSSFRCCKRN
jgi:hypothetical protein